MKLSLDRPWNLLVSFDVFFFFSPLQNRYSNRPIVEFEIAAQEQMKVTELRLKKLFTSKAKVSSTSDQYPAVFAKKVEGTCCFFFFF